MTVGNPQDEERLARRGQEPEPPSPSFALSFETERGARAARSAWGWDAGLVSSVRVEVGAVALEGGGRGPVLGGESWLPVGSQETIGPAVQREWGPVRLEATDGHELVFMTRSGQPLAVATWVLVRPRRRPARGHVIAAPLEDWRFVVDWLREGPFVIRARKVAARPNPQDEERLARRSADGRADGPLARVMARVMAGDMGAIPELIVALRRADEFAPWSDAEDTASPVVFWRGPVTGTGRGILPDGAMAPAVAVLSPRHEWGWVRPRAEVVVPVLWNAAKTDWNLHERVRHDRDVHGVPEWVGAVVDAMAIAWVRDMTRENPQDEERLSRRGETGARGRLRGLLQARGGVPARMEALEAQHKQAMRDVRARADLALRALDPRVRRSRRTGSDLEGWAQHVVGTLPVANAMAPFVAERQAIRSASEVAISDLYAERDRLEAAMLRAAWEAVAESGPTEVEYDFSRTDTYRTSGTSAESYARSSAQDHATFLVSQGFEARTEHVPGRWHEPTIGRLGGGWRTFVKVREPLDAEILRLRERSWKTPREWFGKAAWDAAPEAQRRSLDREFFQTVLWDQAGGPQGAPMTPERMRQVVAVRGPLRPSWVAVTANPQDEERLARRTPTSSQPGGPSTLDVMVDCPTCEDVHVLGRGWPEVRLAPDGVLVAPGRQAGRHVPGGRPGDPGRFVGGAGGGFVFFLGRGQESAIHEGATLRVEPSGGHGWFEAVLLGGGREVARSHLGHELRFYPGAPDVVADGEGWTRVGPDGRLEAMSQRTGQWTAVDEVVLRGWSCMDGWDKP